MITLTRRRARRLRGLFRRAALGLAHRGPVPPLVLQADTSRLFVRHHQPHLAVEHAEPGTYRPVEALAVPLEALADCEGRDDSPVVIEAVGPGRTVVRWEDAGIPQSRDYAVAALDTLAAFPEPPARFEPAPAGLLEALAEAAATGAADSNRYALDCILLRQAGSGHEVAATDGRQLLVQVGFALPWTGDVLVRRTPVCASPALAREPALEVGRSDTHVVLRAGAWTLWLAVQADARFPDVERAIPVAGAAATVLRLDAEDARFLARALARLPGGDELNAPVTLDLHGRAVVRARGPAPATATELVLARSVCTGAAVRLNTNRDYLARALRLGFLEVELLAADAPVVCRDGRHTYAWQPLSAESALAPSDDVVRIVSDAAPAALPARSSRSPAVATGRNGQAREAAGGGPTAATHGSNGHAAHDVIPHGEVRTPNGRTSRPAGAAIAHGPSDPGLAELIGEAVALHAALGAARQGARHLAAALRRHRRRERLVNTTLDTLRQIRFPEVAG